MTAVILKHFIRLEYMRMGADDSIGFAFQEYLRPFFLISVRLVLVFRTPMNKNNNKIGL